METSEKGITCRSSQGDFVFYKSLFDKQFGEAARRVSGRVRNITCMSGIQVAAFNLKSNNLEQDPKNLEHDTLVRILLKKDDILLFPRVPCYGNGIVTGNLVQVALSNNVPSGREGSSGVLEAYPVAVYDHNSQVIYFFELDKNPDIHD